MLYSGVSNRSRGWKSKKTGDQWPLDNRLVRQSSLKKFDGAARSCAAWDNLRTDPDLWLRNGNCFVHLYEKGQSHRGPAFRILFASLLSAQCQPLIERFVDRAVSEEEAHQNGRVDLYIPAPAGASRSEAVQYHLVIRNFFAWVTRRSVVGRHLGNALIGLLNAMDEFREPDADNIHDLYAYLDEEGYLDMRNQPNHALAILHLAESFQMRDLYIDAFAHCVGMSEHLYKHHEYSRISADSRKLIRRARADMDFRLSRAGAMLGNLLKEELSEAHVGLSTGARAHLDRFRAHIRGFYTTRFGRFPPSAADPRYSTIFSSKVYCSMRADFEALYQYLVDETYTTTDNAPSVAQGGLCALQSVHEFDLRHNFPPLDHPLPYLPERVKIQKSRRRKSLLWLQDSVYRHDGKLRTDDCLMVHAALMRATNHTNVGLLDNRLVLAYREFEQDSVMIPDKDGRSKKLGVTPGDARKVRWLFIYAMYQTLRSCTEVPMEVKETQNVPYHLGVSTNGIPPWQTRDYVRSATVSDGQASSGSQPRATQRVRSIGAIPLLSPMPSPPIEKSSGFEIKPDIDYFALTHQEEKAQLPRGRGVSQGNVETSLPRSRSQSLTSKSTLRRSLSIFRTPSQRRASMPLASPSSGSRNSIYHEIIVQGYGNGTYSVTEGAPAQPSQPQVTSTTTTTASRSASTSSTNSFASALSSSPSTVARSLASTTPTTLVDPSSPTSSRQTSDSWTSTTTSLAAQPSYENLTFPIWRQKSSRKCIRDMYSNDDMLAAAMRSEPPPLPRRSSKRFLRGAVALGAAIPPKRWSMVNVSAELREDVSGSEEEEAAKLQISPLQRQHMEALHCGVIDDVLRDDDDAWEKSTLMLHTKGDVSPPCAWDQYTDLGGLQPIHMLS